MSTLILKGVSKRFGGLQAVSPFDMEIAHGKITGLIGPNGAGKTTVVNLITGVYKLSAGSIRFGDTDLTEASRHEVARAGMARTLSGGLEMRASESRAKASECNCAQARRAEI